MVEKVDAKQEIDALFGHLSDVEHYIGVALIEGKPAAFCRLMIPEDGPLRDWPPKLTVRRSLEVGSGVQMFSIHPPGGESGSIMESYVVTEWVDSYQNFVDVYDASHAFIMEVITPKRKLQAVYLKDELLGAREVDLQPEDFELLRSAHSSPPKRKKD